MFYHYDQNNSGGKFDLDDRVCNHVIIEAESAAQANCQAQSIGIYFDGVEDGRDCACCGDRWYSLWGKGDAEPLIGGEAPAIYYDHFAKVGDVYCRVYYRDSHIAEYRKTAQGVLEGE